MAVTARAFVEVAARSASFDDLGNFTFPLHVYIYPQGGVVTDIGASVVAAPGDSQLTILQNITTAVVNAAAAQGFTIARTAVMVPQYVRGQ